MKTEIHQLCTEIQKGDLLEDILELLEAKIAQDSDAREYLYQLFLDPKDPTDKIILAEILIKYLPQQDLIDFLKKEAFWEEKDFRELNIPT